MTIKRAIYPVLAALLLPGLAYAQTNTVATFNVTKVFADGNVNEEVTVRMKCNNALILDGEDVISEAGGGVGFVAINFTPDDKAVCTITEDAEPGYTTTYTATDPAGHANTISSANSANGCSFNGLNFEGNSFFGCVVTNRPTSIDIEIAKVWMLEGGLDNYNGINTRYNLRLECDNVTIAGGTACGIKDTVCEYRNFGRNSVLEPEDITFNKTALTPRLFNQSSCRVLETTYDSVVSSDNNCKSRFKIFSTGADIKCTVTNSVFFEGIPTLSQYGMAIMALLMLGVGFVGFRRFV